MESSASQSQQPGCVAIIPAYNEGPRIGVIIQAAVDSGVFARVLVVDDGSRDDTAAVAGGIDGADCIKHERNRGKGRAMLTGIESSDEELLCFLDADLLHVTRQHLHDLVSPVASGAQAATLAVFKGGRALTSLAQKISPMISGQRCMRRELLQDFIDWDSRYGIEVALNKHLHDRGIEQRIVEWPGAAQVMKEEKRGCLAGFVARLVMYLDILSFRARHRR